MEDTFDFDSSRQGSSPCIPAIITCICVNRLNSYDDHGSPADSAQMHTHICYARMAKVVNAVVLKTTGINSLSVQI